MVFFNWFEIDTPGKLVNGSSLNGIVVAFCGIVVAVLGFVLLSVLAVSCWWDPPSLANCPSPRSIVNFVFYMATAGSALTALGVWKARSGRVRILAEGSGIVIGLGLFVLGLAFSLFDILPFAIQFAVIVYFLGLLGGGLFMGGVVKLGVGEKRASSVLLIASGEMLQREPKLWRAFSILLSFGSIATLVSGWIAESELVTPGGGGFYWGFPFPWKSVTGWLGTLNGFQYDWFWFIIDVMIYTSIGYFALYILWTNSAARGKEVILKHFESRNRIALTMVIAAILFVSSLSYDYVFLWNLR